MEKGAIVQFIDTDTSDSDSDSDTDSDSDSYTSYIIYQVGYHSSQYQVPFQWQ